ncbi:MAG TPA: hypothetical protein VHF06_33800, partial [Pseudonocardiaceae bacterium]|nr:hypothetical protein [Pseudonocardiaceae bacterium]
MSERDDNGVTRRNLLRWGGALGLAATVAGFRPFTADATPVPRPTGPTSVPDSRATTLWYPAPADETLIVQQGLP